MESFENYLASERAVESFGFISHIINLVQIEFVLLDPRGRAQGRLSHVVLKLVRVYGLDCLFFSQIDRCNSCPDQGNKIRLRNFPFGF